MNHRIQPILVIIAATAMLLTLAGIGGCEPYRVEYHTRPGFYEKASDKPLPGEVTMRDGTKIVYQTRNEQGKLVDATTGERRQFQIREEREDGKVILRAVTAVHVLDNTLNCLFNEEYELLWDQMIAQRTKDEYAAAGQGYEEFHAFFRKHRTELARTLRRMIAAIPHQETAIEEVGYGLIRCRLRPQIAEPFKFKRVFCAREGAKMKLVTIK